MYLKYCDMTGFDIQFTGNLSNNVQLIQSLYVNKLVAWLSFRHTVST